MKFYSINPTTETTITEYETMSYGTIGQILKSSHIAYASWKRTNKDERKLLFRSLADVLRLRKNEFAQLMVTEMGDRKSTRLNSSHTDISRMPSSA